MTGQSPDYVAESLSLARETHSDAEGLLERGSYRSAADRAYYSMFHAANAVLFSDGIDPPKTHHGLHTTFGKHLIESDELPRELGRWLTEGYRLRQKSDYDVYAVIDRDAAEGTVQKADRFIRVAVEYVGD